MRVPRKTRSRPSDPNHAQPLHSRLKSTMIPQLEAEGAGDTAFQHAPFGNNGTVGQQMELDGAFRSFVTSADLSRDPLPSFPVPTNSQAN